MPSELSVIGKCRSLKIRVPPAAKSATYEIMRSVHPRNASRLPSAVTLMELMQDPTQWVSWRGFSMSSPVRVFNRETTPTDPLGWRSEEHTSELQSPYDLVC